MLESERRRLIAQLVHDRSVVSISELLKIMPDVSESTIRRDLKMLADSGQLRRVRGGAESMHAATSLIAGRDVTSRIVAAAEKKAIAREAAKLVRDGESIIISAGTTTEEMLEFVQERKVDVLTNSVTIATRLFCSSRSRVMLSGGTMLREQGVVLSPYEHDGTEHFCAQRMFTSCFGIKRAGLMEADPIIVQAQRRLLSRADEVIVLADSGKFRQRSPMVIAPLERISTLITDDGVDPSTLDWLRKAGVKVVVAKVGRNKSAAERDADVGQHRRP